MLDAIRTACLQQMRSVTHQVHEESCWDATAKHQVAHSSGTPGSMEFTCRFHGIGDCPDLYGRHRNLRKGIDHKYDRRCYCLRGGRVASTVSTEAQPKEFSVKRFLRS